MANKLNDWLYKLVTITTPQKQLNKKNPMPKVRDNKKKTKQHNSIIPIHNILSCSPNLERSPQRET